MSATTSEVLRLSKLSGLTSPPRPGLGPGRDGWWNSQFRTAHELALSLSVDLKEGIVIAHRGIGERRTEVHPKKITPHPIVQLRAVEDKFPFHSRRDLG